MVSYIIETVNLSKKYPVLKGYRDIFLHPFRKKETPALHNVTLQIGEGEIFGLLGPNGAGKTTLIKILCTLVLPDSGNAYVAGLDVTKAEKKIRQLIGYVISEERSFYWRLSGRQNLKFFAKLNNIPNSQADQRINRLLDFLALDGAADRMFKDYSTGMRQKLAIARGLLTDPAILFMDEPTNGLDPASAHNLKLLVKGKLVEEEKKTVIFATHNLQDAEELCDRITIIQDGEVKLTGAVDDISMQWSGGKRYVMRLKRAGKEVLDKIHAMDGVKKIVPLSSGSSGSARIEIEMGSGNGSIHSLVKEIIDMGGELHSLHEKEAALSELFSQMVNNE